MADDLIDLESVATYAAAARVDLDRVRIELARLVTDIARAGGATSLPPGAAATCRQVVAGFSTGVLADVTAIVDAVQLAASMAGAPVAISFDPRPVPVSRFAAEADELDAAQLTRDVRRHFTALDACLNGHLRNLKATLWDGSAKADVVLTVSALTKQAIERGNDAEAAIAGLIGGEADAARPQSV